MYVTDTPDFRDTLTRSHITRVPNTKDFGDTYKEPYNTIIYYPNTPDVRDPLSRTPITTVYMFLTHQISEIHLETACAEIGSLITVSHICPSAGNSPIVSTTLVKCSFISDRFKKNTPKIWISQYIPFPEATDICFIQQVIWMSLQM
jgi:hypothetical protein